MLLFRATRRHYDSVASQLTLEDWHPRDPPAQHRARADQRHSARRGRGAATTRKTLSPDVRAVYVDVDPAATEQLRHDWPRWGEGVPLVVLESPYRSLMEPLLEYIEQVHASNPGDYVTVVLPEFVPAPAGGTTCSTTSARC